MGHLENKASLPEACIPLPRGEPASELSHPQQTGGDGPKGRQPVARTRSQYLLCWFSQALTSARAPLPVIPSRWGLAWEGLLWGQGEHRKGWAEGKALGAGPTLPLWSWHWVPRACEGGTETTNVDPMSSNSLQ